MVKRPAVVAEKRPLTQAAKLALHMKKLMNQTLAKDREKESVKAKAAKEEAAAAAALQREVRSPSHHL